MLKASTIEPVTAGIPLRNGLVTQPKADPQVVEPTFIILDYSNKIAGSPSIAPKHIAALRLFLEGSDIQGDKLSQKHQLSQVRENHSLSTSITETRTLTWGTRQSLYRVSRRFDHRLSSLGFYDAR